MSERHHLRVHRQRHTGALDPLCGAPHGEALTQVNVFVTCIECMNEDAKVWRDSDKREGRLIGQGSEFGGPVHLLIENGETACGGNALSNARMEANSLKPLMRTSLPELVSCTRCLATQ